jgi:hypothetical protein
LHPIILAYEKSVVDSKSDLDGQGQEGDFVVSFRFVSSRRLKSKWANAIARLGCFACVAKANCDSHIECKLNAKMTT